MQLRHYLCFACLFGLLPSPRDLAQSSLSQNSGINSADTWVTMDVTFSGSDTATFSSAVALLPGQTPSNTVTVSPPTLTMHVEAGYDASGGLVINIWPTGTTPYAMAAGGSLGMIRLAGGQMTIFDQNGNPRPVSLPGTGASANWPLSLLGSNPGPSVIGSLVVPSIQSRATALSASVALSTKASLSPVSATVSGATVQLTSTLNGSATNYPLSASYTYTQCYNLDGPNTNCFSSPAFTTATSGSTLTGGTN